MHLSKYCKIYINPEDYESLILFSTKNAAIIEIPKTNFENVLRNISPPPIITPPSSYKDHNTPYPPLILRGGAEVTGSGNPSLDTPVKPEYDRNIKSSFPDLIGESISLFKKDSGQAGMTKLQYGHDFVNDRINKRDWNILKKYGFLIDDPEEERKELLGFIEEINETNRALSIKVVMSLDCNLSCKYCFEGTRKGKYYMTKKTADDLIEFVRKKIETEEIDEIRVVFYGGEPLLSKKLIIYIAEKVKALAKRKRIPFNFHLQTNGTLLTKKTVETLKPLGLKGAFVTLDGPKENHDKSRPYKSGIGSFDRIIRNIKDACRIIDVHLNGNYTRNNFEGFPALIDFLLNNGLTPKRIPAVDFFPVTAESGEFGPPEFHDGCSSINEPWLLEASLFLREEILKKGFPCRKVSPGVCMMEHRDNIVVNYDGSIYKCPGLIGREEFIVGDLGTGIKDYRLSHNLDNWKTAECLNCSYLPLCFGGCRYMKFIRDGNMDGVDCGKPYFDAALERLIDQDVRCG